jgi:putative transposase
MPYPLYSGTMLRDLVIQVLLSAVWRFCVMHKLVGSMSRRGNAYANAAVESFFAGPKKEQVRRRTHRSLPEARADVFHYIEVFYNRKRRHERLGGMSPGKINIPFDCCFFWILASGWLGRIGLGSFL